MSIKNNKINKLVLIVIIIQFIYPNNSIVFNLIAKKNKSPLSIKSDEKIKAKLEDKVWEKLRGSWRKISFKEKINGEFVDFDWHIGGELYLIYDGLGGCAIISQSKNYFDSFNNFDNNNNDNNNNTKDLIKKSDSYYYFASCKINKDTIEHTKLLHSNPNEVGDIAKRKFKIVSNGMNKMLDTLILIPLNFDNYAELKLVRVD